MVIGKPCPDDETLVDFLEGRLSDEHRRSIDAHLVACTSCREQVAVCADVMNTTFLTDDMAQAPAPLTRKTLERVGSADNQKKPRGILTRTRRLLTAGLEKVERLTLRPEAVPVVVRGSGKEGVENIIRRQKTFNQTTFIIELERTGPDQAVLRVFPDRETADCYQTTKGELLRVSLFRSDRELVSATVGKEPVVFEDIDFGAYVLTFVQHGEKIGEYAFEVNE
jgi:hypothetical protein